MTGDVLPSQSQEPAPGFELYSLSTTEHAHPAPSIPAEVMVQEMEGGNKRMPETYGLAS